MHTLTDDGNAQRLVERFGPKMHYCPQVGWLIWNQVIWERSEERAVELAREVARDVRLEAYTPESVIAHAMGEGELVELDGATHILKWAKSSLALGRIEAMLKLARSDKNIIVQAGELNSDPLVLAVANGVLSLRTRELLPPDPKCLVTCQSPVTFIPGAQAPRWHNFLNDVTNGNEDLQETLQQAAGYALTGLNSEQCMFILHGMGANGKSTFLSVLRMIMGPYGALVPADTILAKRFGGGATNDLAALYDKRLVVMTESEMSALLNESKVKAVTGEGSISARFLYHENFEFKIQFKMFIGTNHKPQIRGGEDAIWRRIRLIPFEVQIQPDKIVKDLQDELFEEEGPGILNWMLDGCTKWLEKRQLFLCKEVIESTDEYRAQEDIIGQFIDEAVVADSTGYVDKSSLYKVYVKWADTNGLQAMSKKRLGSILKERGWHEHRTKENRWWMGVSLTGDAEQARISAMNVPFGA